MQVVVNGHSREVADDSSVASLLADLQVQTERVAVELNLQIVDRGAFAVTALRPGDRIEVIGFIGGGGGHA
jgi:sulfur carrier protein